MTSPPPGWYELTTRVPRQGQTVRVVTDVGVSHVVRFEVAHTDDWPSGASWALANGHAPLPFTRVALWSPDLAAPLPAPEPATASGPESASTPAQAPSTPPVLSAALAEIDQTLTVLHGLPPDQYDWSPHPDIVTLRTLARRLVRIVARTGWILELDSVELLFEPDLPDFETANELVMTFQSNADAVRALVPKVTEAALWEPWRLERNGETIAETPRGVALRRYGIAPMAYHRGEAAVLLTALGVSAPHPYPEWPFKEASRTTAWAQPDAEAQPVSV